MHGRQHLVGINSLKGGLMLSILRYADELRDPKPYFENINAELNTEAVGLAKELVEAESGKFEPQKIPDKYAETLRELLRAKIEQRAPQIEVATEGKAPKGKGEGGGFLLSTNEPVGPLKIPGAIRNNLEALALIQPSDGFPSPSQVSPPPNGTRSPGVPPVAGASLPLANPAVLRADGH
jgi:hypothetical protein